MFFTFNINIKNYIGIIVINNYKWISKINYLIILRQKQYEITQFKVIINNKF